MDFITKNIWFLLFVVWGLPLGYYRSKFRKIVYQTDSWVINIKPVFWKEIKGLFGNIYPDNVKYKKFRNFYLFYLAIYALLFIAYTISTTNIGKSTFDIVKAYADPDLVQTAIDKAQKNDEVKELLGTLEQVDIMAKLEGSVKYLNNDTSVDISVRVKGSKGKGRMRIIAERNGENWEYKKIVIGIKKLKRIIKVQ